MTTPHLLRKASHRSTGFTLVEIMIVIGIIALLSAVALPSLSRARDASRRASLLKQLQMNMNAYELYAAERNKLPLEDPTVSATSQLVSTVPAGMASYMPKNSNWTNLKDGAWQWYYWPGFVAGYKGFYWLYNPNLTVADIQYFDTKLDDGNLNTGAIMYFNNGGNGLLFGIN